MHEALTNIRPVIFLRFADGTPRDEVWRGLRAAATLQAQCGKIVIAVSEDIDPRNLDAIFWSLAYRSNLAEDIEIMRDRKVGHGPKSSRGKSDSGVLIDATRRHDMPPLALPTEPYMTNARAIWEELGLPALNVRPPWHGYSLGDWTDAWERFANNAVAGRWDVNGRETFARRRGGMKPETPVREIEDDD
jgi:4-hydroxy-3-polyprenylbenzoate decarboxylase